VIWQSWCIPLEQKDGSFLEENGPFSIIFLLTFRTSSIGKKEMKLSNEPFILTIWGLGNCRKKTVIGRQETCYLDKGLIAINITQKTNIKTVESTRKQQFAT
jgi:hypothetical protein